MNRNIRIEIALGIILLVTVIVGGVIWLQAVVTQPVALVQQTQPVTKQPSVPSELWKTYLNSEFGFQFDYLASSGLDTSKLKVVGGECGGGEKCVELLLPTADGDFMPDWIKNPTPEDVAKYMKYDVLYVHIADQSTYDRVTSKDCLKTEDSSAFCNPETVHKGNKIYISSNGKLFYLFDNAYGQKPYRSKPYPSDGIPWNSLGNFKAL